MKKYYKLFKTKIFHIQTNFPTLTRMMGAYGQVGGVLRGLLEQFDWRIIAFLFHNHGETSGKGNSECFSQLSGVFRAINITDPINRSFNEETVDKDEIVEKLEYFKTRARSEFSGFIYYFIYIKYKNFVMNSLKYNVDET